jgi:uncharacterized membrane protein (UPF0127 family)
VRSVTVEVIGAEGARRALGRAQVAKSYWSRLLGLMGKRELPDGEGMLIDPCSSVHTLFMRFPLDVVFLDREDRITHIAANLRPYRMAMAKGGKKALELAAGTAADAGLATGNQLVFRDAED